MLNRTHHIDGAFTMLLNQKIHFMQAYTMLAGTSAIHRNGARDHALINAFGTGNISRIIRIDQHLHMEITIADMTNNGVHNIFALAISLGLEQAFGQT